MKNNEDEFAKILKNEDEILTSLLEKQNIVKKSVIERNWENLVVYIKDVNELSQKFEEIDIKRDEIQKNLTKEELKKYFEQLGKLRTKLLKCKVENRVLSDYVNIAKDFIQEVIEKALPQTRNKNYSRTGKIIQPQPQSVVVNQLF